MGCETENVLKRGCGLLSDGPLQCEHADAVWGKGREGVPKVAGRDLETAR